MKHLTAIMAAGAVAIFASESRAADEPVTEPAAREILNSISLEISPEFNIRDTSTQSAGSLNDVLFKIGYSRALGHGWSWGISDQQTARAAGDGRYQNQLETTIGYSVKVNDTFSVPLSAGVGYVWDTRAASSALRDEQWAYYTFSAGLNVKFDQHWTWNAINARYRDAFEGDWITPKVTTGVTYTIDPNNAVYANVGYAWKTGAGGSVAPDIGPDKWNLTFGYKIGF
jgi:hypothetical protein